MTTALPSAERHRWDEVRILREHELRSGIDLADTSQFRDDTWSLAPATHQQHMRAISLSFSTIPQRYRQWAKELFCCYLAMPLPAGEPDRLGLMTIRSEFTEIKRFTIWLHDHRGAPNLAELTGQDIKDYADLAATKVRHDVSRSRTRAAIRRIWRYRNALPGDRLPFDPQHIEGWSGNTLGRRGENRTDRLPEPVMGPLIVWATRFVDVFSLDILAMTQEWAQLRRNHDSIPKGYGQRRPELQAAIEKLMDRHRAENRPLPGRKGVINYSFLANVLSTNRSSLDRTDRYVERINATAAAVGISDETYFYTPVRQDLDGQPWLDRISNEYGDGSLPVLARLLQIACYVLISFYSGMRDSEVKHVNRGCLRIQRDADGNAYRWKVHARAFKGERNYQGVPATWVVGEPAAHAVQILEQLQPDDTDILFQTLPYGVGWAEEHRGRALNTGTTNEWLNRFVRWVNDYCATHHRTDTIPNINGSPWRLKTSQFRRTLAWFIARRPGGVIAGALAFRHHAIQMFEGYAGTSDSGFRAEVESEQALARGEQLVELADTYQHTDILGPAGAEAATRLQQFALNADGFAGNVISDERRLKRLMKRHDPAIYPGAYVTCVYRHDKALCQRGDSANLLPDLTDCKPLTCRNVALTTENLTTWISEIGTIDRVIATRPTLPPMLEQRLRQRRNDISVFLERNNPELS